MKSAIFESLNDRSNIANAYMRMVNETAEEISAIAELFKDKKHPLTVIDDSKDPPECVIDLEDIEDEYLRYINDGNAWETKDYDDRYYISLAFDKVGLDEVYKKILEEDSDFCLSPAMIHTMNDSMVNTIEDLKSTIAQIGKDWEEDLHKDDIEVAIPKWAVVYLENGDNTSDELTDDDYEMVDDFVREWYNKGYELVYDGTDLGFGEPVFGDDCNRVRYYLMKMDNGDNTSQFGESAGSTGKELIDSFTNFLNQGLPKSELRKTLDSLMTLVGKDDVINQTELKRLIVMYKRALGEGTLGESIEDGTAGNGWFDESGTLKEKIPHICIKECTRTGTDASSNCLKWVRKLKFDEGLDIPLAKGFLKNTGGYTDEELMNLSPEETAMTLLWVICGDIKDGIWPISLDSGNHYKDDFVSESTYSNHHVILSNGESMIVEVIDGEDVNDVVDGVLFDSYGYVPKYRILKDRVLGSVEVDDDAIRRPRKFPRRKRNEVVSQSEVDKLKKKNPRLKDISEQL